MIVIICSSFVHFELDLNTHLYYLHFRANTMYDIIKFKQKVKSKKKAGGLQFNRKILHETLTSPGEFLLSSSLTLRFLFCNKICKSFLPNSFQIPQIWSNFANNNLFKTYQDEKVFLYLLYSELTAAFPAEKMTRNVIKS